MNDAETVEAQRKSLNVLSAEGSVTTPPTLSPTPSTAKPQAAVENLSEIERKLLEGKVTKAIRAVYDPEIPVNIYELGLIYNVDVDGGGNVKVRMTLTAPACPVAGSLPGEVEKRIEAVPGVTAAEVELVWEPPWSRDMMSEAARLALDMF